MSLGIDKCAPRGTATSGSETSLENQDYKDVAHTPPPAHPELLIDITNLSYSCEIQTMPPNPPQDSSSGNPSQPRWYFQGAHSSLYWMAADIFPDLSFEFLFFHLIAYVFSELTSAKQLTGRNSSQIMTEESQDKEGKMLACTKCLPCLVLPVQPPRPHLLAEAFNGLSPSLRIASLSRHLLHDVAFLHGTLDLWRGKDVNRLSTRLLRHLCPPSMSLASWPLAVTVPSKAVDQWLATGPVPDRPLPGGK